MYYYEKSVLINCPVEKAFKFHSDTNNLKRITPDFISTEIIKIDLPLKLDGEIILDITQFRIIKNRWIIRLTEFNPQTIITDTQINGPFKIWIHKHCFESKEGNTFMTDKVNYELPFGIIGKIANKLFVRRLIKKQFEFRQKITKKILEA